MRNEYGSFRLHAHDRTADFTANLRFTTIQYIFKLKSFNIRNEVDPVIWGPEAEWVGPKIICAKGLHVRNIESKQRKCIILGKNT